MLKLLNLKKSLVIPLTDLVPITSKSLVRTKGNELVSLGNQALTEVQEKRLVNLLLSKPELIASLSQFYPLDELLIQALDETGLVRWEHLSRNEALPWSIKFFERFEDKWHWEYFSGSKALPWCIELIEDYEDKLNWGWLSISKALPWSIELIERFENKWIWESKTRWPW